MSHGLPVHLTSFIGREREIAGLRELLRTARLITITGAAGSGKSRLAVEVAARAWEAFPDRILWVDVAPLSEAGQIRRRILGQLGPRPRGTPAWRGLTGTEPAEPPPSLEEVLDALEGRTALLVLDGCEHLVGACADLVASLLHGSAGLRALVTSREPLGVEGEHVRQLGGLGLPARETEADPAAIEGSESGRLFLDRARAVLPSFEATWQNAGAVAQICRRLDGIPLALELAAGRARMLSAGQIARRLDDALGVLTSSSRTALPRHRTLRAAIEWSYDLLDERERRLLERLSVFPGSFTLEAAEAVCGDDTLPAEQVLDLLSPLVDKSLLMVEGQAGEARYRLLEPVAQFARARLEERSEAETFRRRLGEHTPTAPPEQDPARPAPAAPPEHGPARPAPEPVLRVRALGPLEIEVAGRPLEPGVWKRAKPKELLLYLLCHPAGRTREQVGLVFWPDASAAQVKNSFHVALHRLRKRLGRPDLVVLDGRRYRIATELGCEFDAFRFESEVEPAIRDARTGKGDPEALRAVLALYRGDFLTEERVGDWYLERYDRLRRLYADGALALADLLAAAGRPGEAAEAYRRVLAVEELDEAAHRGLMRSLFRMGGRARALRHYDRVVELLAREVDGSPEKETSALYERLRQGEPI